MDNASASDYVYAKASGMIAHSFSGAKAHALFEVQSLQDLWSLVFKTEVPLIPEVLLARKIEKTAEKKFISDYKMLVNCYNHPAEILLRLARFYDYCNIKAIGAALCSGEKEMPDIADIGKLSMLNYSAWPDIEKITKNSAISWYNSVPCWENQKDFDRQLDIQYTRDLWESVQMLPSAERGVTLNFIQQQIELTNCIWALRLRVYYNMSPEEIIPWLVGVENNPTKNDILAEQAIKILDFSLTDKDVWSKWKYNSLLNKSNTSDWKVDPRWFEQAVNVKLNKIALCKFHENPFTALVLVCWFKIKQTELNMIRRAAEGLRLNSKEAELKDFGV